MSRMSQAEKNRLQYARITAHRTKWLKENGPCQQCGSYERLEIDHVDPSTKDPMLAIRNMWYWNKERRDTELVKCQVLCEDCHRVKSNNEKRVTHCIHGHEYTPENTLTFPGRPTIRECRTCKNAYNRRLRATHRLRAKSIEAIKTAPRLVVFS